MHELRRVTIQGTLLVIGTAGIAFIFLAVVGGPLVRLIFGDQYSGLGSVVATLCLGMFARILVVPIDAALVTLRRGRAMFAATFVQLLVILGSGFPLIRWLGLDGVGYAMALSFGAAALIQWGVFLRGNVDEQD
jgi:O-antigen/teichoic acid export membrane protein